MTEAGKFYEKLDNPEQKEQNDKAYVLGKGKEALENAKNLSPESNKDGRLDGVYNIFSQKAEQIDKELQSGKITEKEKNEKMTQITEEFISEINSITGTTEASQAKQNKEFSKTIAKNETDYKKMLNEFADKLKIKAQEKLAQERKENGNKEHLERQPEQKKAPEKLSEQIGETFLGEPKQS